MIDKRHNLLIFKLVKAHRDVYGFTHNHTYLSTGITISLRHTQFFPGSVQGHTFPCNQNTHTHTHTNKETSSHFCQYTPTYTNTHTHTHFFTHFFTHTHLHTLSLTLSSSLSPLSPLSFLLSHTHVVAFCLHR